MIRHKFAVAMGLTLGAALAHGDVLVNTFGANGTGYFAGVGWNINSSQSLGKTFAIGAAHTLTSIDIAFRMNDDNGQFLVSLRPDSGGQPGGALEAFTVTNAFGSGVTGVYNLNSAFNPLMVAGTYYVTIEPLNDSTGKWNLNNGAGQGDMVVSNDGGASWSGFFDTNGVVRVTGEVAVPEPASVTALLVSAGVLVCRRRRNP